MYHPLGSALFAIDQNNQCCISETLPVTTLFKLQNQIKHTVKAYANKIIPDDQTTVCSETNCLLCSAINLLLARISGEMAWTASSNECWYY